MNRHDTTAVPKMVLRADLIAERIRMGSTFYWVLKDPLARAYYYFSDREFAILKLLDGRRRLNEITRECSRQFMPDYVAPESIVGFLADARDKGLVLLSGGKAIGSASNLRPNTTNSVESSAARSRSWFANPLAIRLPGINPDRMLDHVAKNLRWLVRPSFAVLWLAAVLFAAAIAATHFDLLSEHVALAANREGASWWLTLLVVISLTKIAHELGHAVVCKSMGAECRELGVMLLVGVPCLYCDVSDAWMLKERYKRILVSFAGIATELLIAAAALVLWSLTDSAILRDLCVCIVVVCSVSTIIFNGNPLLRYDGYFILSDLIGIPNLGSESTSLIHKRLRSVIWSLPDARTGGSGFSDRRNSLAVYGILSGVYRVFVFAFIAMLVYRFAGGFGLHSIGGILASTMIVGMLWRTIKPVLAAPPRAAARSSIGGPRRMLFATAFLVVACACLFVPFRQTVTAPVVVMPANAREIIVTEPGVLLMARDEGAVGVTDMIARLKNADSEMKQVRAQWEVERLETLLKSLRQRETFDASVSAEIPATQETLETIKKQNALAIQECERLTVRAPKAGTLFAPPNRIRSNIDQSNSDQSNSDQSNSNRAAEGWTGTPLDSFNRGAYLEAGTSLGIVGDTNRREALALVRQQEIELIRVGQNVSVWIASRNAISGQVIEISASPIKKLPRELIAAGLIGQASIVNKDVYYQVRIDLNETASTVAVRSTRQASIAAVPASIWQRVTRVIGQTLRM